MKKLILFTAILSFLFSAGAIAGEQDTIWTKSGLFGAIDVYFTNDDQTIITNKKNKIVELDVITGDILRESDSILTYFKELELSVQGNLIFILHSAQDYASLVRYNDFSIIHKINVKDSNWLPHSIAISADEQNLAIGVYDRDKYVSYILIYDTDTGDLLRKIESNQTAKDLKYSPEGSYLAAVTAAYDYHDYPEDPTYYVQLYDAKTYQHVKQLDQTTWRTQKITAIDFNKDGSLIFESCRQKNSIVWNIDDYNMFKEYSFNTFVGFMKSTYDRKYTAITALDYNSLKLYIYDNEKNKMIHKYPYDISDFDISNNQNLIIGKIGGTFNLLIPYWNMNDVSNEETKTTLIVDYSKGLLSIDYELKSPIQTKINLFDNTGKMIKSIFSGLSQEGMNRIEESIDLISGVYHLQVKMGKSEMVKKFLVVR